MGLLVPCTSLLCFMKKKHLEKIMKNHVGHPFIMCTLKQIKQGKYANPPPFIYPCNVGKTIINHPPVITINRYKPFPVMGGL